MKIKIIFLLSIILLSSCSEDYEYNENDFNLNGGIGRTNNFEHFGNTPLQLAVENNLISDDSSGVIQTALRLKSPYWIVSTVNGNIIRLNNNTADKYFKIDSSYVTATGMTADKNQNIYFIASDDRFYALSENLELKWIKDLPVRQSRALTYSDLLALDDCIYIGTNDGDIFKYDNEGNLKWSIKSSLAVVKSFSADSSGNIYSALTNNSFGANDSLICIDSGGNILWGKELTSTRILSSSVYSKGRIYVSGSYDTEDDRFGKTYCFDRNGNEIWNSQSSLPGKNVSVDNMGNCYVAGISSGVGEVKAGIFSFDKFGKESWKLYFGAAPISPLIISEKYLSLTSFTGDGAAYLIFRKSDGLLVKNHSLSNFPPLYLQPVVADDATIKLFGSSKLTNINFTQTSLNLF
ncbi:MAG: hypothetical protein WC313_02805 [Candidatus Kapaibacterium sp.]